MGDYGRFPWLGSSSHMFRVAVRSSGLHIQGHRLNDGGSQWPCTVCICSCTRICDYFLIEVYLRMLYVLLTAWRRLIHSKALDFNFDCWYKGGPQWFQDTHPECRTRCQSYMLLNYHIFHQDRLFARIFSIRTLQSNHQERGSNNSLDIDTVRQSIMYSQ